MAACPAAHARSRKEAGSGSVSRASAPKLALRMSTAICAASSPCTWPPSPSATANSAACVVLQWPTRSSLVSRAPRTLASTIFTEQHFLQREHALRPAQMIELQAPVDRLEELRRVL